MNIVSLLLAVIAAVIFILSYKPSVHHDLQPHHVLMYDIVWVLVVIILILVLIRIL